MNSSAYVGDNSELMQRLAQAALIVTGVAGAPEKYKAPVVPGRRALSEHDPDWWVSTIKIASVEKGVYAGGAIDILFPHSMDIAWARSPKIKEGDHGTWLLHDRDQNGKVLPSYSVIYPLDFQPIEQIDRVRKLVSEISK
jgi:hypothetical protein